MNSNGEGAIPTSLGGGLERPLLLFDGDCGFCRFWVERWRAKTRGRVDYAPAQQEAARFPQVTEERWKRAAQLVMPDGAVLEGAEAMFTALAQAPEHRWALAVYRVPGIRQASDAFYRLVADHRDFFSALTKLAWGRDSQPASHVLSRWIFLRLLGLVYVIAFLSLRVQIIGLIGAHGLLPAADFLQAAREGYGAEAWRIFPTLAWLGSSDAALTFFCSAGAVFGLLVMLGVLTRPALALAWVFYLSLSVIGQDFFSFQWDALLLEAGFIAIFLAPAHPLEPPWRRNATRGSAPASSTMVWLGRWLLFRLMFLSGAVKLLSGDPNWRNLSALNYHYWTQPLPTPVGWYAAQLPAWFQTISVAHVFLVELAVPFLIFTPRRFRHVGAIWIAIFELLIALTGNYCFFNLLTIALCVLLLDDSLLRRWMPKRLAARLEPVAWESASAISHVSKLVRAALAALLVTLGVAGMLSAFRHADAVPEFVQGWERRLAPFQLVNSYGLFAIMTTTRIEIIVEGSNDGASWQPYEFKYKPGDLARRPAWVAPYQPRLDWQMWFAALGNYRGNPWFVNLMTRLLEGSPEATALLASNPFPNAPPRYIRATAYDYRATDFAERRATGNWWRREREGVYFPEASLRAQ